MYRTYEYRTDEFRTDEFRTDEYRTMSTAIWIGGGILLAASASLPLLLQARSRSRESDDAGLSRAQDLLSQLESALDQSGETGPARTRAEHYLLLAGAALAESGTGAQNAQEPDAADAARSIRFSRAGLRALNSEE